MMNISRIVPFAPVPELVEMTYTAATDIAQLQAVFGAVEAWHDFKEDHPTFAALVLSDIRSIEDNLEPINDLVAALHYWSMLCATRPAKAICYENLGKNTVQQVTGENNYSLAAKIRGKLEVLTQQYPAKTNKGIL